MKLFIYWFSLLLFQNGMYGYEPRLTPPVVATADEAPNCVTVHHVKAEVYEPPPANDQVRRQRSKVLDKSKPRIFFFYLITTTWPLSERYP